MTKVTGLKQSMNQHRVYEDDDSKESSTSPIHPTTKVMGFHGHCRKNIISIDPGIKIPFMGYSNIGIYKLGSNLDKIVKHKLTKIDNISRNSDMTKIKKQKLKQKWYDKIKNKITDFHWKTINLLTDKFHHILIGNFSTKKCGENKTVHKMTKRIGNQMNLFKFKQRLKYKCTTRNVKYSEVNEAFTSKCCNRCGNYKKDLTSTRKYNCSNCGLKIHRDINGAINIFINAIKNLSHV